ncbi:MAG: hypothetical protein KDC02_11755, partial [Flavobacteriales bacterium]|nr:hypothetical protein [Flavobacteriales bacterium]
MKIRTLLVCAGVLALMVAQGQSDLLPRFNVDDDGLWVDGYDPVAYLLDHRAVEGDARFSHTYQGATFHFVDQAH